MKMRRTVSWMDRRICLDQVYAVLASETRLALTSYRLWKIFGSRRTDDFLQAILKTFLIVQI